MDEMNILAGAQVPWGHHHTPRDVAYHPPHHFPSLHRILSINVSLNAVCVLVTLLLAKFEWHLIVLQNCVTVRDGTSSLHWILLLSITVWTSIRWRQVCWQFPLKKMHYFPGCIIIDQKICVDGQQSILVDSQVKHPVRVLVALEVELNWWRTLVNCTLRYPGEHQFIRFLDVIFARFARFRKCSLWPFWQIA